MKRAVVVTTEHRGIFFGYVLDDKNLPEKITLENARMCVRFVAAHRGVVGLANVGPTSECRISYAAPKMEVWKITAVLDCTIDAINAWESAPWS